MWAGRDSGEIDGVDFGVEKVTAGTRPGGTASSSACPSADPGPADRGVPGRAHTVVWGAAVGFDGGWR